MVNEIETGVVLQMLEAVQGDLARKCVGRVKAWPGPMRLVGNAANTLVRSFEGNYEIYQERGYHYHGFHSARQVLTSCGTERIRAVVVGDEAVRYCIIFDAEVTNVLAILEIWCVVDDRPVRGCAECAT